MTRLTLIPAGDVNATVRRPSTSAARTEGRPATAAAVGAPASPAVPCGVRTLRPAGMVCVRPRHGDHLHVFRKES